jgi:hypothetical protein
MENNFFYSFKMNSQPGSFEISVDDVTICISYINPQKINPIVRKIKNGYNILYKNIYNGIDIELQMEPTSIKEFIYVKNRDAEKSFSFDLNIKNGSVDYNSKDRKHIFCDLHGNIVFEMKDPYIVDMENRYLKKFVKLSASKDRKIFNYKFDHTGVKKYPVKVDPSFVFNTRIKNYDGVTYGDNHYQNSMMLTGKSNIIYFILNINNLENNLIGCVNTLSDDVLFENEFVIIFPYTMSKNVDCFYQQGRTKGDISSKEVFYQIGQLNDNYMVFSIYRAELSLNSPGTIDVICSFPHLAGSNKSVGSYTFYSPNIGYPVSYKRKITYVPKIDISFDRNIDCIQLGLDKTININDICIKTISDFKPIKYNIVPYVFKSSPGSYSYTTILQSDDFTVAPKKIGGNSYKYFTTWFDISYSSVPIPTAVEYTANDFLGISGETAPIYKISKGNLNSFINEMDVVLFSGVNGRTNAQQGVRFFKRYYAVSTEDVIVKKESNSKSLKNLKLRFYIKSFMSFILNEGYNFNDYFDYCESIGLEDANFSITERENGDTVLSFFSDDIFEQNLSGDLEFLNLFRNLEYKKLSDDILKNCYLVCKINNKISTFEIIGNTNKTLILKGRVRSSLLKANSFCVLIFDPNEIYFENHSNQNSIKLIKNDINEDGYVVYKDIIYNTDLTTDLEEIKLFEKKKNFTMNKSSNLYTLPLFSD